MSHLSGVWSERNDPYAPNGAWRDCTQASYLMCLMYGEAGIPNAFTIGERERFEDAEGLPEYNAGSTPGQTQETGLFGYGRCDRASRVLYGVELDDLPESGVWAALNGTGHAIALTGQSAGLPSGYTGSHSVCVVPRGDGTCWVYDPLAPMGSGPTVATAANISRWHAGNPYDARIVRDAQFAPPPDPGIPADPRPEDFVTPAPLPTNLTGRLYMKAGRIAALHADGTPGPAYPMSEGSSAPWDAFALVGGVLCVRATAGVYKGLFVKLTDCHAIVAD